MWAVGSLQGLQECLHCRDHAFTSRGSMQLLGPREDTASPSWEPGALGKWTADRPDEGEEGGTLWGRVSRPHDGVGSQGQQNRPQRPGFSIWVGRAAPWRLWGRMHPRPLQLWGVTPQLLDMSPYVCLRLPTASP